MGVPMSWFPLVALVGCTTSLQGTEATSPPVEPPPAAVPPTADPQVAVEGVPDALEAPEPEVPEAELADQWFVIVASARLGEARSTVLDQLAARPDLAPHPRRVVSSRFKNLVPCLDVSIADATDDKATARAQVAALQQAGFDAYLKHAGAYVGPSAALDAFCATAPPPPSRDVRVAAVAGGAFWLPVDVGPEALRAASGAAPAPVSLSTAYDAWSQPLDGIAVPAASVTLVDAATGERRACTTGSVALLTLGTPHFGMLSEDAPPTQPSCGTAAPFTRLACDGGEAVGTWVASGSDLVGLTPRGEGSGIQLRAVLSVLERSATYRDAVAALDPDVVQERSNQLTLWHGDKGDYAVIEARAGGGGVCGGDEATFVGVFALEGDEVGPRLGDWWVGRFANLVGVVDVAGDGRPELVVYTYPNRTEVVDLQGQGLGGLATDYCDCPC